MQCVCVLYNAKMIRTLTVFTALLAASSQTPVTVTVFYESLCPGSKQFMVDQVFPAWTVLTSEYFKADFVPYGHATQQQDENGTWTFSCQHGRNECKGNKLQACALNLIADEDQKVKFIHCVMSNRRPYNAGSQCATSLDIDFSAIKNCTRDNTGDEYLAALGDRTHNFRPALTFVPAVVFDGVFNAEENDDARSDLIDVICKHINGTLPTACSEVNTIGDEMLQ